MVSNLNLSRLSFIFSRSFDYLLIILLEEVPNRSIFELADIMMVTVRPYLVEKAKKKSFFCIRLSASPEAVDEGI